MQKIVAGILLILCTSCDQPAIKSSESLVGSPKLAPAQELKRETIWIEKGFGGDGYGSHRLSHILRPNNELAVRYSLIADYRTLEEQTVKLTGEEADRHRRALWRLRPQHLSPSPMESEPLLPEGCERRGPHDQGDVTVTFLVSEEGPEGASFELPEPSSCDSQNAKAARVLLSRVLSSFPHTKAEDAFREAKTKWEARLQRVGEQLRVDHPRPQ